MKASSKPRALIAAILAVGLAAGTAALTQVPVALHGEDEALLRLSWRMEGAVLRDCRPPTEEERARMPAHMAREEICVERLVPYRLEVELDGREILGREVAPRGARGDRPLSVFHEVSVAPGEHRVGVRFVPSELPSPPPPGSDRLPRLELDTVLVLGPRDVGLVTHDRDGRRLEVRTPGGERQGPAPRSPGGAR